MKGYLPAEIMEASLSEKKLMAEHLEAFLHQLGVVKAILESGKINNNVAVGRILLGRGYVQTKSLYELDHLVVEQGTNNFLCDYVGERTCNHCPMFKAWRNSDEDDSCRVGTMKEFRKTNKTTRLKYKHTRRLISKAKTRLNILKSVINKEEREND